ncbi:MAG: vitamin B12-dependent ribonucleotide reductase [Defluviitaleaceae bacterium]|nr:vitamin B12-dependent ribonucleotide reductase [Defluviitaleaceae bacterium]
MELTITRHFTKELEGASGKSVYDLFEWKTVDVKLKDYSSGKLITDMAGLEFPAHYQASACDIIASKYFRKKGVNTTGGGETSMRQVAHRMVSFWTDSLLDLGMINGEQRQIVYDETVFMMLSQMWAPNSPQWFNTGLASYGITGNGNGHYYYDTESGQAALAPDSYSRTQGSACFIVSIADSLMGDKSLTDQLATETLLFKYGSGVGTNWSVIRAKNEILSGGGKSSGLLSFLKVSDKNAGAIKSGGTTRRAAKMNILNLDHPEIMDYIMWKSVEEDKVEALGKMGYSTSIEGEAYETVSGQNVNNSVRIPDEFMRKLNTDPDEPWQTSGRVDKSQSGQHAVGEIWNKIGYAAWRCGDPGVQFDDTINAWHTCPAGEDGDAASRANRINASNPCSEYMFLDDTACNLASINIVKFYDSETGLFDMESYLHVIKMVQLVLEATIHWGQFPTRDIARRSHLFRTTGLGLTNVGALFMMMAVPYDSEEARAVAASLTSIMTGYSYYISALMAGKVGAFECYGQNAEHMKRVIRNHARAAGYSDTDITFEGLEREPVTVDHEVLSALSLFDVSDTLRRVWSQAVESGEAYGYRNAQVSVYAPTGTIAFAMDCATTSSEPYFSHISYKKLVGGGFMVIINPTIEAALKKLGYSQAQIDEISAYVMRKDDQGNVIDGKIEGAPHLLEEHYPVFDTASKCGSGKRFIQPEGHVKMMGALSPHVTGGISKTVNLSSSASIDDVKQVYLESWKLGVKAITVYRDGCKVAQPLSSALGKNTGKALEDYTYQELLEFAMSKKVVYMPKRVKPSGIRSAKVHEAQIDNLRLYITASYYEDGRLGEIYISSGRQGTLTKGLLESLSQTISEMLQYGVPPSDIARMYRGQKFEPSGYVTGHPYIKFVDSISDLISKVIDIELGNFEYVQVKPPEWHTSKPGSAPSAAPDVKYTAKDYIYGEICPNCKSTKMVRNGTCKVCTECGSTTGCS